MARPQKEGMEYFPHDTDAVNDEKIEILMSLYGTKGYSFYFILLERIYRNSNYEIDISDAETIRILSRKISISESEFNEILNTAIKYKVFDRDEYENRKVLTSNGIKKRAKRVEDKRAADRKRYEKSDIISASETNEGKPLRKTTSKAKKSKGKNSNLIFCEGSIEMSLALELVYLMRRNNPNVRIPNDLNKWALEIDKMLRIDGRSEEDIRKVIYFTQNDDFWQCNILSTRKLREKFDQLYMKCKNTNPQIVNAEEFDSFKQVLEQLRGESN